MVPCSMIYHTPQQLSIILNVNYKTIMKIRDQIGFIRHGKYFLFKCIDFYNFIMEKTSPRRTTNRDEDSYAWDAYLTPREAADFFNVSYGTFYRWINKNKIFIPFINITDNIKRFSKIDMEIFMKNNLVKE